MRERESASIGANQIGVLAGGTDPRFSTEERYRLILHAIAEGIYEWTVKPNHLELSARLLEMFGFEPGELTSANWVARVHPEDRGRYRGATVAHFKGSAPNFSCQYRILNKAGEWRWVSDRAASIRDSNGRVLRLIGAVSDITEFRETLQQQDTTAEVLKAISRSTFDLQAVLDTLVESATRLCEADHAWLFQRERDVFRWAAGFGHSSDVYARIEELFANREVMLDRGSVTGRVALDGRSVHIHDVRKDREYTWGEAQNIAGYRTALGVPLLRNDDVIGVIFIGKVQPQPFSEKQIKLVSVFADQAVIAIEHSRLFNELRHRSAHLSEALERQTATSEVLRVISESPGNLAPVFQAMLEKATSICGAKFGMLFQYEGGFFHLAASLNLPPLLADFMSRQSAFAPEPGRLFGRLTETKSVIHVIDRGSEPEPSPSFRYGGARSSVAVPMIKDNELVGALFIYRTEVRPFTDKQIELVQHFAAQAVTAIENTRLLNDLHESLQQQTATADVLKTISRSTFDLKSVLQTLVESAARLCEADMAALARPKGPIYGYEATFGHSREHEEFLSAHPAGIDRGTAVGRTLVEGKIVHIPDVLADPGYTYLEGQKLGGFRTLLGVPLLREGTPIGVIVVQRKTVRPFTERQIEFAVIFADQAVIAIENNRLVNELRESLQQQTATADVLKVISRSAFDLQTVLNTLVESAARLCEAEMASMNRQFGAAYRQVASYGFSSEFKKFMETYPVELQRGTTVARAIKEKKPVQIPDVLADKDFDYKEGAKIGGVRTVAAVPMLKGDDLIGVIALYRREVRPFTDKQIELVTTFADQAVIAIENVRLFDEIQDKSRQLAEASQHKSQFLANMSHELRTPLNAIIGVSEMLREDAEALKHDLEPLDRVLGAGRHLLALINDILDLSKIEAGRMELHLETFPLKPVIEDVAKTIEPMATKNGNRVVIECPADLDTIHADQTRFRQSLLNLASNANKFTEKGTVTITAHETRENGRDWIMLAVTDSGIGMTAEQMGKLFQEFSQALYHREQIRWHWPWPRH
jgi:PAS domain S-box-containing protein